MKKIAFLAAGLAVLTACTKWENLPTEKKIEGLWNGKNFTTTIQAIPFLDSTFTQSTTDQVANFMENGGLTIDSAGTRLDSLGWSIENDTMLVLTGMDNSNLGGMGGAPTSTMRFDIQLLTELDLVFIYDTTMSVEIDPSFPPINIDLGLTQRWTR
ncbi:MAG: hypothetical protein RL754_1267 [Bacteroidota bacterium]|jgi:hypothetical protein